jgi:hypothetical protein
VGLTLGIDSGDGSWEYSDGGVESASMQPGGQGDGARGEWVTFSYQSVLYGARFSTESLHSRMPLVPTPARAIA